MAAVWAAGPDPIMQSFVLRAWGRSSMASDGEREGEEMGIASGKRFRDFFRNALNLNDDEEDEDDDDDGLKQQCIFLDALFLRNTDPFRRRNVSKCGV